MVRRESMQRVQGQARQVQENDLNNRIRVRITSLTPSDAIYQFLDKEHNILLFYLNQKDEIVSSVKFPVQLKRKAVYFMKRRQGAAVTEKLDGELMLGDMSPNPLEFLSTILEEVYLPILTNQRNLEAWPDVVAGDVLRHFHQLNGAVYVISGKSKGRTMLPLPHESAKEENNHLLEAAVIEWTHQIKQVIQSNSADQLLKGLNPGPMVEIEFWTAKAANLKSIHTQLTHPKIQKISSTLDKTGSKYHTAFQMVFEEVAFGISDS